MNSEMGTLDFTLVSRVAVMYIYRSPILGCGSNVCFIDLDRRDRLVMLALLHYTIIAQYDKGAA